MTRARLEAYVPTMLAFFDGINADVKLRPARQVLLTPENTLDSDSTVVPIERDAPGRGLRL